MTPYQLNLFLIIPESKNPRILSKNLRIGNWESGIRVKKLRNKNHIYSISFGYTRKTPKVKNNPVRRGFNFSMQTKLTVGHSIYSLIFVRDLKFSHEITLWLCLQGFNPISTTLKTKNFGQFKFRTSVCPKFRRLITQARTPMVGKWYQKSASYMWKNF